ncbi:protein O-mannosyl-transferase TMTC2 [Nephila pilipes]|uniref:dolichyl-phosphate-mannose--protein mannosyltransferase n=1 Tax=Nephila pilipes TaxID=299642 RepID=A0A8X6Q1G0_NEPPI|nr:protein O-mannosyl-transferase TMTC2 [Nephila pilipes]
MTAGRAIKTNQDLLPTTPISQLFMNDFWGTPLTHSGSHKSYRPLCVLTFRLNYWLGGFDPWGYHFINVLLHSLVSAIFTKLAASIFLGSPVPTIVAGLLFAAHPIHTEAVAGIVGRADVGACLFFLLCILLYIKYCEYRSREHSTKRWLFLYASLICAACSMLTKEHGITVLGVCVIYELFIYHRISLKELIDIPLKKQYYSLREGLFHLIAAGIALLGLRFHLMGSKAPDFAPADNPAADNDSFVTRTLTFLYLPAFNFWLMLCPRWLSFDWSMEAIPLLTTLYDRRNFYTLAFYGSILIFAYWLMKAYSKRCTCGNGVFCAAGSNGGNYLSKSGFNHYGGYGNGNGAGQWCPCSNISQKFSFSFPSSNHNKGRKSGNNHSSHSNGYRMSNGHGHQLMANGNLGNQDISASQNAPTRLAFAGPADTVTLSMALLILPFIPATNLFFYVGFVVAERVLYISSMGFCFLIALGVDNIYRRQETVFRKRIVLAGVGLLMLVMSARTVIRNTDWLDEENLYRSGIPVNPPKAYGNLANILSGRGEKEEAEWAYKKALSYRSNMADVRYNLGILLQEQGRYEEALYSYRLAIQFRPRLAMAHLNMGLVLGILGRKEEAAEVYRHCAELDSAGLKDPKMHESTRISALFNLGRLYADDGKYEQAVKIYHEAVNKMPDHYQPQSLYNMMGEAYFKLGSFVDAEHWYREALRVKPDHIPAHLTYAKLLTKWGRLEEAEQWFVKAKFIAPNDSSVYQHYGQFLSECERHNEAADMFVRAAELASDEYEIVFNAANTLRQAGRNTEAETYYQIAVKLRPNEVTSHMNLGAMFHVNGKLPEAESCYLDALKLRPDDPITQNNLVKLRNLLAQRRRLFEARNQNQS